MSLKLAFAVSAIKPVVYTLKTINTRIDIYMLQLSFLNANKSPVWLVDPKYIIGGNSGSDIVLDHPSILAQHAEILVEGERVYVLPCDPSAEVWVNGERVIEKSELDARSELRLGELSLTVVDPKSRNKAAPQVSADHGWYLQAKTTALANKRFDLDRESTLGRAKECEICLGVAHLSRKHARLRPLAQGIEIEDLNSSNGTFLNGKRVSKGIAKAGDEIRFDTLSFRVCNAQKAPEDGSTTCLRQAISQQDIAKQAALAKNKPVSKPAVKPVQAVKPARAPQSRPEAAQKETQGSAATLYIGITAVALLTVAGIVFLMT